MGRAVGVLQPAHERLAALAGIPGRGFQVLVVDDRHRVFPIDHFSHLRTCEGSVEVQRVRSELGAGNARLDEAPVVAAHDRDAVPRADASLRMT